MPSSGEIRTIYKLLVNIGSCVAVVQRLICSYYIAEIWGSDASPNFWGFFSVDGPYTMVNFMMMYGLFLSNVFCDHCKLTSCIQLSFASRLSFRPHERSFALQLNVWRLLRLPIALPTLPHLMYLQSKRMLFWRQ
jgi:hypothetical protein